MFKRHQTNNNITITRSDLLNISKTTTPPEFKISAQGRLWILLYIMANELRHEKVTCNLI